MYFMMIVPPNYQIYTHNYLSDYPLFEEEKISKGKNPATVTVSDQTFSLTLIALPTMPISKVSWNETKGCRSQHFTNKPLSCQHQRIKVLSINARTFCCQCHANVYGKNDIPTLPVNGKNYHWAWNTTIFPIWCRWQRWQPPDEWLHTDEWKSRNKATSGWKIWTVTTILPGWQVQIAFDAIALSKNQSGFTIPRCEILNWQLNPLTDETDNIYDLYHYFHCEYQLVFNFFLQSIEFLTVAT